jgi:hypothetical protein
MNYHLANELFVYDPETGELRNRVDRGGLAKAGALAGYRRPDGYVSVAVKGKRYPAHRVAWLMTHGVWPAAQIDHVNGVRDDNRMANLRESTNSENLCNRGSTVNNRTGFKGVCWDKNSRKYKAQIMVRGKITYLGLFTTPEAAHAAYQSAVYDFHGAFANPGVPNRRAN